MHELSILRNLSVKNTECLLQYPSTHIPPKKMYEVIKKMYEVIKRMYEVINWPRLLHFSIVSVK